MNRLKQLRIEANESQEYVGTIIGVSGQAVGQYELEKRELSPDKILKLAEHYNCTTDYLLGKTDVRNYDKDEQEFRFAYHKETEGLTDEEISDALRFYKEMKKRVENDKK